MSKQKQKEPLSIMIVKTVLAMAVFTGLGTIIFGGGVVIMKYYGNEVNNRVVEPVDRETENYYGALEKNQNVALLQSAEILEILCPLEIIEVAFYEDGGTTGIIAKDDNGKDFFFCLDGRMQIDIAGKGLEPRHLYMGATYLTDSNAQEIPIAGEKEKAILYILKDWANKQVSKEEQLRLLNIRTVVGLSKEELKIYRILKVIKRLEDRNKTIDQPDTSDWQTYRNEEFGFEVKYPESFVAREYYQRRYNVFGAMLYAPNQPDPYLVIRNRSWNKYSFERWLENIEATSIEETQNITAGNLTFEAYATDKKQYYFINEKDSTFEISTTFIRDSDETFNQILSTFKFIEN